MKQVTAKHCATIHPNLTVQRGNVRIPNGVAMKLQFVAPTASFYDFDTFFRQALVFRVKVNFSDTEYSLLVVVRGGFAHPMRRTIRWPNFLPSRAGPKGWSDDNY